MGVVKANFVSEYTLWMREQLAQNPAWEEDQRVGRALWWDKKQELATNARYAEATVAAKSYPYDVNF